MPGNFDASCFRGERLWTNIERDEDREMSERWIDESDRLVNGLLRNNV